MENWDGFLGPAYPQLPPSCREAQLAGETAGKASGTSVWPIDSMVDFIAADVVVTAIKQYTIRPSRALNN
jgi:hypothetical protein